MIWMNILISEERKEIQYERDEINKLIQENQGKIRIDLLENGNLSKPRTQAKNIKSPAKTVDEQAEIIGDILSSGISAWGTLIPGIIKDFSELKDPRRVASVKHQLAVIMMYGLLIFLFRFPSRKHANLELTEPLFCRNIQAIFPEIDSNPHGDTVANVLEKINPIDIQEIQIKMIKKLIKSKKFKQLLIKGNLPIAFDGVEKIKRNGGLHDVNWLERKIGPKESQTIQQYVYVVEANITFQNGLTIPLMTEFLYFDGNNKPNKQDCELLGFKRIAKTLKSYFKRQDIVICLDKLYACQSVIQQILSYHWECMIVLPANKLTKINSQLANNKPNQIPIPGQASFNGRKQYFYWKNDIDWRSFKKINAVACFEQWEITDKNTGEIIKQYSEHKWITTLNISIKSLHELCNLCARKRWLIEDSNNTEKNRGYGYKHAFSYDWNGMGCFHFLMRLAHAINALSEFTKKLKDYIKDFGISVILNKIKNAILHPWVTVEWIKNEIQKPFNFKIEFA
jgi:hypothetical protein